VLDSFYANLRSVGVSAVTGEGMEELLQVRAASVTRLLYLDEVHAGPKAQGAQLRERLAACRERSGAEGSGVVRAVGLGRVRVPGERPGGLGVSLHGVSSPDALHVRLGGAHATVAGAERRRPCASMKHPARSVCLIGFALCVNVGLSEAERGHEVPLTLCVLQQVAACAGEYREFYVPELEKARQDKVAREAARQRAELAKLQADLAASKLGKGGSSAGRAGGMDVDGAEEEEEEEEDV
jgi:hypothetical protein